MKVIKIILGIIAAIFLIVGIPIIINECYKANCGYITVWDGADVLGYYGAILGSIIAVATLAITIVFTKKQIQRDSFLNLHAYTFGTTINETVQAEGIEFACVIVYTYHSGKDRIHFGLVARFLN